MMILHQIHPVDLCTLKSPHWVWLVLKLSSTGRAVSVIPITDSCAHTLTFISYLFHSLLFITLQSAFIWPTNGPKICKDYFDFYYLTYINISVSLTLQGQNNIFFLLHSRGSCALTWNLFNCYLSASLVSNTLSGTKLPPLFLWHP